MVSQCHFDGQHFLFPKLWVQQHARTLVADWGPRPPGPACTQLSLTQWSQ